MKKFVKTICCLLILIALTVLALTPVTAYASPPTEVSGTYTMDSITTLEVRQAGGNLIIKDEVKQTLYDPYGVVTGTSIFERTFTLHSNGKFNVQGICIVTPSMGVGTYTQRVVATGDMTTGTVQGTTVILSGTGYFTNIHGHGTITGDPNVGGTYSGKIHFDPD